MNLLQNRGRFGLNILFSGAVFHPEWKGGEPVVGKELIKFLSERHTCRISKSLPYTIDKARSILRFLEKDNFFFSGIVNRSEIDSADIVLSFYDFDCSIIWQCIERKIPIISTQHVYWGLCPKWDFWNNVLNCSCSKIEPYSRDCKKCLSKQGTLGPQVVSSLFSTGLISGLRNSRKLCFSRCDAILVPSNYMARLYKKELGKVDIRVVHNGIDTQFYKPMPKSSQGRKKRILYAGARTYTKGYHHFVKLASEITTMRNDVEFIAFGYGKRSAHSYVKDLGYLSKSDVRQAYSDSYLLVFPSLWDEPFGLVPLESMACGCPVVAYGSGGVPETVVNGLNGRLVLTGDYSQLLQTTLDLIDNESENNRMRKYSREYIVKNFSLWQMLDSYERTLFEFAKA
jgi:glycosyltransferase involved in cell wall biosynthesis